MKEKVIVVAGPTASGKSGMAVRLGQTLPGSVISCDSMQVYRGLDIGSAKITAAEMQGIPHYMIDVAEPEDPFYAARFKEGALEAMKEIREAGRMPILCGGTGFYINAVLYETDFDDSGEGPAYRQELIEYAKVDGNAALHARLAAVDPEAAAAIHMNNVKRVIRALEYYRNTGQKISDHNRQEKAKASPYDYVFFVLTDDRQMLYERIDKRVDAMVEQGLFDEVRRLYDRGLRQDDISMQGISYRQIMDCFEGKSSCEATIERIKQESRHYAKRQLTWFRRQDGAVFLNRSTLGGADGVYSEAMKVLAERGFVSSARNAFSE